MSSHIVNVTYLWETNAVSDMADVNRESNASRNWHMIARGSERHCGRGESPLAPDSSYPDTTSFRSRLPHWLWAWSWGPAVPNGATANVRWTETRKLLFAGARHLPLRFESLPCLGRSLGGLADGRHVTASSPVVTRRTSKNVAWRRKDSQLMSVRRWVRCRDCDKLEQPSQNSVDNSKLPTQVEEKTHNI